MAAAVSTIEIARASAVLVDVTGHNANVALELGLVHALGRPCRVVAQRGVGDGFPSLAKVKIHGYSSADRCQGLTAEVAALLRSAPATPR